MFEIKYSNSSLKFLSKLDSKTIERIRTSISKIPNGDIKRLHGETPRIFYRLRVGKYRVIFRIIEDTVFVDKIDTRGDVYK